MEILDSRLQLRLRRFCTENRLPAAYERAGHTLLWPMAGWLARQQRARGAVLVVGVNGAQGTGKSTLCALLRALLELLGLRAAVLSIDDLYLRRDQRLALARRVHPLLATRGVPGTHDVALGAAALERLRALAAGETLELPRFDKALDDRDPRHPQRISGPVDVVLFEGWCVGTPPQPAEALVHPVNALEADEDPDGRWRRWVNERLQSDYAGLFASLDLLIFLRAPDFAHIYDWRRQQEADTARTAATATTHLLDEHALRRFVGHYERLTRHALRTLPDLADAVVDLDADHTVTGVRYRDGSGPGQAATPSR